MPRRTTRKATRQPAGPQRLALPPEMALLRDLTQKTGVLHDAQALQLKVWPRVALPHTTRSEAEVDVEECRVKFVVQSRKRKPAHLSERLSGLAESVRALLGDWWEIEVVDNGESTYYSARQADIPSRRRYGGTDFEAGRIVPEKPWQFRKPS